MQEIGNLESLAFCLKSQKQKPIAKNQDGFE